MTGQPDELDHLLDRTRHGVILPAEGEQLVQLVEKLRGDAEFYEAATSRMRDRAEVATVRATRAEATVARVRQAVDAGPVGSCCAHLIHAALNPPTAPGHSEGAAGT